MHLRTYMHMWQKNTHQTGLEVTHKEDSKGIVHCFYKLYKLPSFYCVIHFLRNIIYNQKSMVTFHITCNFRYIFEIIF